MHDVTGEKAPRKDRVGNTPPSKTWEWCPLVLMKDAAMAAAHGYVAAFQGGPAPNMASYGITNAMHWDATMNRNQETEGGEAEEIVSGGTSNPLMVPTPSAAPQVSSGGGNESRTVRRSGRIHERKLQSGSIEEVKVRNVVDRNSAGPSGIHGAGPVGHTAATCLGGGDLNYTIGTCSTHAGKLTIDKFKGSISSDSVETEIREDVEKLQKWWPNACSSKKVYLLLLDKWKYHGESSIVDKLRFFADHIISRSGVNANNPEGSPRAGLDATNQGCESTNRWNKQQTGRVRHLLTTSIGVEAEWLKSKSQEDLEMNACMNPKVNSQAFWLRVQDRVSRTVDGMDLPLFRLTIAQGYGVVLVPSSLTIKQTINSMGDGAKRLGQRLGETPSWDTAVMVQSWKRKPQDRHEKSWVEGYNLLRCNFDKFLQWLRETGHQPEVLFDAVMEWNSTFYQMEPITHEEYVRQLKRRLEHSGVPLCAISDVKDTVHFMSCTCNRYLHYSWCSHSAGWAVHHKLIEIPSNFNNKVLQRNRKRRRGRPCHSKPGQAWTSGT